MVFSNLNFMFESALTGARKNTFNAEEDFRSAPANRLPGERTFADLRESLNANADWKQKELPQTLPIAICQLPTAPHLLLYNLLQTGWAVVDRFDRLVIRLSVHKPLVTFLEVVTFRSVLFPIMFNRFLGFLF